MLYRENMTPLAVEFTRGTGKNGAFSGVRIVTGAHKGNCRIITGEIGRRTKL